MRVCEGQGVSPVCMEGPKWSKQWQVSTPRPNIGWFFNKNKHAFRQSLCPNVFLFVFAFKLVPADILRAYSDSARVSMIIWSRWLGGYSRLIYILGWFVLGEPTSARSTRQYQDNFCTESFGMRWNSWYEHLHLYVCSFLIWSFFSYFGHLSHACFCVQNIAVFILKSTSLIPSSLFVLLCTGAACSGCVRWWLFRRELNSGYASTRNMASNTKSSCLLLYHLCQLC